MKEDIKLIIFDMDGTLYDIRDLIETSFMISVNFLVEKCNYKKEDAKTFLLENGVFPYVSDKAKSCTQLFVRSGIDIKKWNDYRSKAFPYQDIKKEHAITEKQLLEFKKTCPIVLLTNSTIINLKHVLEMTEISEDTFDGIFINDQKNKNINKQGIMKDIMKRFNVEPINTLSIGDRYDVDGKTMLDNGGKALIIKSPASFNKVIQDFPNFKNCEEYTYYENDL